MSSRKHSSTGARAVTVAQFLVEELGWIFRRQPEEDFGIDAHIEVVAKGEPTGRLVAAQIKGGTSYFKTAKNGGHVFYIDEDHFEYWSNFSLPVIIVLVDIAGKKAYWQHVTADNVGKTPKGWKIFVPTANQLVQAATDELLAVGDVSEPVKRLTELTLARTWMRFLAEGKRLFVEVEEWVNKSSGRGALRLILQDDDSEEEAQVLTWPIMFLGGTSFEAAVRNFFPWASVDVDEELYDETETERWIVENGMWDSEEGRYLYDHVALEEHMENRREYAHYAEVGPYQDDGEVAKYRLELTLNDIGRGFLAVANFLYEAAIIVRPAVPGGVPTRGPRKKRR